MKTKTTKSSPAKSTLITRAFEGEWSDMFRLSPPSKEQAVIVTDNEDCHVFVLSSKGIVEIPLWRNVAKLLDIDYDNEWEGFESDDPSHQAAQKQVASLIVSKFAIKSLNDEEWSGVMSAQDWINLLG